MTSFGLDAFGVVFFVYGADEILQFDKATGQETPWGWHGRTCENHVWINGDAGVCYHEAVHMVDWLLEDWLELRQGELAANGELRARLVEWVGRQICASL